MPQADRYLAVWTSSQPADSGQGPSCPFRILGYQCGTAFGWEYRVVDADPPRDCYPLLSANPMHVSQAAMSMFLLE